MHYKDTTKHISKECFKMYDVIDIELKKIEKLNTFYVQDTIRNKILSFNLLFDF